MSYIHSSPKLKTLAITFVNDRTTWYCPQMSMLLSNEILFTGCYFVIFISVVHSHILCVFLIIPLYCMYLHMPYVLIKELTYLLTKSAEVFNRKILNAN